MSTFFLGVGLILAGGFFCLFLPERWKAAMFTLFVLLSSVFLFQPVAGIFFNPSQVLTTAFFLPLPFGNVRFVLDILAAFFILVIYLGAVFSSMYSIGYLKPYLGQNRGLGAHFWFLGCLITSLLLVTVIQNMLVFLIAWEIMSLSSFFLVVFENEKKEVLTAGLNYLINMHLSLIFLLIGFMLIFLQSGSLDFGSFKLGSFSADFIFMILFIGFGLKAGFYPLHTWLPKAHPAAPSHISAFMSGVMIKAGIFGLMRFIFILKPSLTVAYGLLFIAMITMLFGIAYAAAQGDYKKLLAYCSIENIGIIGLGMAVGLFGLNCDNPLVTYLGFGGAMLHVLNHALSKSLLFLGAGAVYKQTHTRDIEKLGGLIKKMPKTGIFFLIGSLAITGLPPFNNFVSEFLIFMGLLKAAADIQPILFILTFAGFALTGAVTLLCFTKVFGAVFLGRPRSTKTAQAVEKEMTMLVPMGLLACCCFLISVAAAIRFAKFFAPATFIFWWFVSAVCLLALLRFILLRKKTRDSQNTWACGYAGFTARMQYTASSLANSFLVLSKPFFKNKLEVTKPEGFFPERAAFESKYRDVFEDYVINPFVGLIQYLLNKLNWIQSGETQKYILYGVTILILALFWVILT